MTDWARPPRSVQFRPTMRFTSAGRDALFGPAVRCVGSLVGQAGEHGLRFSLQVGQELADLFVASLPAEGPQMLGELGSRPRSHTRHRSRP